MKRRFVERATLMCLPAAAALAVLACPAYAAPSAGPGGTHPSAADTLSPSTRADLDTAMGGEAYAHASYTFYAAQADREGLVATGRLYRETAAVELGEHFREEADLAGVIGSDVDNLRAAIAGETYETTVMYPTFAREAAADGDDNAAALFTEIAKDEGDHLAAYQAALKAIETGHGTIPAPPAVDPVDVPAGGPQVRSARTKANLDTALHGEALAHARYTVFADHAAAGGRPELARLFHGISRVELHEHFAGEAVLYGLVSDTRANLIKSITGELYEAEVMYPSFARRATAAGDYQAARLFRDNAADEAGHAQAFQRMLGHPR
ncbi:ferritin family protein [Streptomyces laurentii]|uniref:ferritin family protein n=1 Tax=Streptomyces laurentii TaxID=39478 RepID=UPI0036C05F58